MDEPQKKSYTVLTCIVSLISQKLAVISAVSLSDRSSEVISIMNGSVGTGSDRSGIVFRPANTQHAIERIALFES